MNIEEYFEFRKNLNIDHNKQETFKHIDMSLLKENNEKINLALREFVAFLSYCGFPSQEIVHEYMIIANEVLSHPDSDDFSLGSKVENMVNNEKEFNSFFEGIIDDYQNPSKEGTERLKDIYRTYVISSVIDEEEDKD